MLPSQTRKGGHSSGGRLDRNFVLDLPRWFSSKDDWPRTGRDHHQYGKVRGEEVREAVRLCEYAMSMVDAARADGHLKNAGTARQKTS